MAPIGECDEDFREIDEIDALNSTCAINRVPLPHSGQGFVHPFLEPGAEGSFITPQKAAIKPSRETVPNVVPEKNSYIQCNDLTALNPVFALSPPDFVPEDTSRRSQIGTTV